MEGGSGRLPIPFWILIMQYVRDIMSGAGQLTLLCCLSELKPFSMIELAFESIQSYQTSILVFLCIDFLRPIAKLLLKFLIKFFCVRKLTQCLALCYIVNQP